MPRSSATRCTLRSVAMLLLGLLALPGNLLQLTLRRFLALSEPTRKLLSEAAVLGRQFSVGDFSRIAECTEAEVVSVAGEGVRAQILSRTPKGYAFLSESLRDITRDERILAAAACSSDGHLLATTHQIVYFKE